MERKRVYYFVTILLWKDDFFPAISLLCMVRWKAQNFDGIMNVYFILFRWGIFWVCVCVQVNQHTHNIYDNRMRNSGTYIFHLLKYTQETRNEIL